MHGIFATKAPNRPNPISLSVVRLDKMEKNKLYVQDVDILDRSPLLDIKPYIPKFDVKSPRRIGWYGKNTNYCLEYPPHFCFNVSIKQFTSVLCRPD